MNADSPSSSGIDPKRAARKDDHVRLADQQQRSGARPSGWDDIAFLHHALGAISPAEVDITAELGPFNWPLPFYINGMTGGTDKSAAINRDLAIAAREVGVAIASGSTSVALDNPATAAGFTVMRKENPNGFVMANIGVGRSGDDAKRAIDLLEANALQLHVNAVQETVMPEGARDFSTWLDAVEEVVAASSVPVIVKEVGFGLSRRTLAQLADMGVAFADVSGKGGTDFLAIEASRTNESSLVDYSVMTGFGQTAAACLIDAGDDAPTLLASGGIRNPYDAVKALALGAKAVGVAGLFLKTALDGGPGALINLLEAWREQITATFALLGAASAGELAKTDVLVYGELAEFARLRGVDVSALADRSATFRPRER